MIVDAVRKLFARRGMTKGKLTVHFTGICPSYCKKCGRQKPRADSSPCFRCVIENVKEAEMAYLSMATPPEYVI